MPARIRLADLPLTRALKDTVFAVYTAGHFASQIGTWTQQIAVSWLAWTLTQSETWLGVIAFCQFVPALFLAPISGAVADRFDRLRVASLGQLAATVLAVGLYILAEIGLLSIQALAIGVLLMGAVSTFSLPSMRALVSELVPRESLGAAISLNSITVNIARFTGPTLGAILIHADQLAACFLVNALSFIVFLVALLFVSRRRRRGAHRPAQPARSGSFVGAIRDGVLYSLSNPLIRSVFAVYLAYSLLARPAIDLLPAIVAELLGGGSETLALLTVVFGVAAILGGVSLANATSRTVLWHAMTASMAALAVGLFGLIATASTAVAALAMIAYGIGQVVANVTTQTLSQLFADDQLRGRVMALHFMIFRTGAAIGGLLFGWLSEQFGMPQVFGAAAGLLLIGTAILALRRPPAAP